MTDPPKDKQVTHTIPVALSHNEVIGLAKDILRARFERGTEITNPDATKDYLQLELADHEQEVFACLFLDNRHRVIQFEKLFFSIIERWLFNIVFQLIKFWIPIDMGIRVRKYQWIFHIDLLLCLKIWQRHYPRS